MVSSVSAVAMGQFNGKPVIISAGRIGDGEKGRVEVWDAADGRRLHAMGTADPVSSVLVEHLHPESDGPKPACE